MTPSSRRRSTVVIKTLGSAARDPDDFRGSAELNGRRIPSPGSTWKRSKRRASGWMGSGVRAILRNERYRGIVQWNASEWRKDPDTGRRKRVARPREEWISHVDE